MCKILKALFKPKEVIVEKIVYIEVPIEKIVTKEVIKEVPVEKIVEKIVEKTVIKEVEKVIEVSTDQNITFIQPSDKIEVSDEATNISIERTIIVPKGEING